MAGSAIQMPGALYSSPLIPADFGGLRIPSGILATVMLLQLVLIVTYIGCMMI